MINSYCSEIVSERQIKTSDIEFDCYAKDGA